MKPSEAIQKVKRVKGLYAYESDYEALDACKVCKDLIVEFGDGTMTAEMEELIHNEMEQKEWVNAKAGPASKILSSITDTIMDIHPVKIAEAIKEDKLRDWCVEMQVSLNMLLVQLPIKHEE